MVSMSICGSQGDSGQTSWGLFKGQIERLYSGRGQLSRELMFSRKEVWTHGNLPHANFPLFTPLNEEPLPFDYRLSLFFWNTSLLRDLWLLCTRKGLFHRKTQHIVIHDVICWSWQFSSVKGYIFHFAKKTNFNLYQMAPVLSQNIKWIS